jgi:uncharacterized peroxidase-related enzyme
VRHHGEGLRRLTQDDALVAQLKEDYTRAALSARERALLDYALKLTLRPSEMRKQDLVRLREAGLSDAAILDLNLVTSYYAFVNRLADGLGVELEHWWGDEGSD